MAKVKQVIVYRRDLYNRTRSGKTAAQVAHASLNVFLDRGTLSKKGKILEIEMTEAMIEWMNSGFAKICLYVENEKELLDIYQQARKANIPCSLITDAGKTEFKNVATRTCIALGPDYSEAIDLITGHLKLL